MREYKQIAFWAASTFLFCSAALTNNLQMYWMATTLILILIGTYWFARLGLRGLEIERRVQKEAWEGKPVEVHIRIKAKEEGFWLRPWLLVRDRVPESLLSTQRDYLPVPFESSRRSETHYTITPLRRGVYKLGPLEVVSTDPIGLYWMVKTLDRTDELLIYPRPVPIPNWEWVGAGDLQFQMSDLTFKKGQGLEWQGTREYVPGDPLRRIHWRATARTNQWHVKEYEAGYMSEMVIALDLYPFPVAEGAKEPPLETAVRFATWLSLACLERHLPVRLVGSGWGGVFVQGGDPEARLRVLRALATVQAQGRELFPHFVGRLLSELQNRVALCLMCTHVDTRLMRLAQTALHRGFPVALVSISDGRLHHESVQPSAVSPQ